MKTSHTALEKRAFHLSKRKFKRQHREKCIIFQSTREAKVTMMKLFKFMGRDSYPS